MKKKSIAIIAIVIVLVLLIALVMPKGSVTINNVKSEKELYELASSYGYYHDDIPDILKIFISGPLVPFAILTGGRSFMMNTAAMNASSSFDMVEEAGAFELDSSKSASSVQSSSRDYSKTNIQVENVDEADVTKTDGYYIYSLSNSDVIITDVNDINNIKIASRISSTDYEVPVDLILYKDKLVVIYEGQGINDVDDTYSWRYYYDKSTLVRIYDISDRYNPKKVKSYEFDCDYNTSRCIDNRLYVISSGYIQYNNSDKKAFHSYYDDSTLKEIDLKDIKYIDGINSNRQTIISFCDLDNISKDVQITDYLFDVNNAYVSRNAMYILQDDYSYYDDLDLGELLKSIFSLKGIFGLADFESGRDSGRNSKIIKFDFNNNGSLSYASSNRFEGQTLNQYSIDEKDGYLRVAVNLGWNDGAKVLVFDDKLNLVGQTNMFGKNEQLYSSRFVGDRAYVVTYRNTDPFFVIDLSDVKNPKLLGELKIPGYSSYLHPYDENHLIGFGMETKEVVNRDSYGRVSSTSTYTVGMKMALFDVTDVTNPKEIAKTVIGDSRTTSAILSNPKALLFSKERNLIAIPANRYDKDFQSNSSDYYSSSTSSYMNYWKDYVSEGYLVYDITLDKGFNLKGSIEHPDCYKHVTDIRVSDGKVYIDYDYSTNYIDDYSYRYYYRPTILIRGIYINDNLYTVSQKAIYVNDLKTLDAIDAISLDKE
ncbi:MAG: beta-propeller domain-containing protein [Clostridia bacterium]|nr:beta-propeller domain-containing protein [Clostridia bacterium]